MNQERLMNVLLAPHISEKSTRAAENKQYVFRVMSQAKKPDVRKAVELMFDVKVDHVRIVNVKGKTKRFGASTGRRSNWKKAYVALKSGFEIDLMGAQ